MLRPDTQKFRLLELIGICGEFPADQLNRLFTSPSYAEKIITELKADKLIRTHYKDKLRGYRLTKRSKELLLAYYPARFHRYLSGNTETNVIRSEPSRRIRLHQKAQTYLTLLHAGIPFYPDGKPHIFSEEREAASIHMRSLPLFYSSREIKELGAATTKIKNSRSMGILMAPHCIYIIYNTGSGVLKWEYKTEVRLNAFLQHYLQGYPYSGHPKIRAIMLGDNMETAFKLLTSTGGYKRSLFMLDTSFEHFHYLPNNLQGETLLQLLTKPVMEKQLNELLLSDMNACQKDIPLEHDAVTKDGNPALLAYDFDMQRINRFNTGLNVYGLHGNLICFDFQIPVLKEYLTADIQFSSIDLNKFRRGFYMNRKWWKLIYLLPICLCTLYAGGYVAQFIYNYQTWSAAGNFAGNGTYPQAASLHPKACLMALTRFPYNLYGIFLCLLAFGLLTFLVMRIGYDRNGEIFDKERNLNYSTKGTYGTSGFMTPDEMHKVLELTDHVKKNKGTILGKLNGKAVCLPYETRMNRNVAVYGASGSMKSRTYARNMIFQCVARGESLIITDPKSELYESMAGYLENEGYTVRCFNLVNPENSDAWNCLMEIDGQETMAQVFSDVIIQNTGSAKGDHFWDNAELNLLKALVLYVEQGFPPESKNIGQVYKLLTLSSEKELNSLFDLLPVSHPAKVPYCIYKQASDTVRSGVIIGLGARLQVFQNKLIRQITSYDEIDLTLPGKEKCAYFCITSDQDSAFDFLSSLFMTFVFIKLVRFADKHGTNGRLPVPVHILADELANTGAILELNKKISVCRSRGLSISCIFQNLPQMQNRYPYNQWQEIIGNCDTQLFLGCTDEVTAEFISARSGDVTVGVSSEAKQLNTWRVSDYSPEYRKTQSIGKRKLLTPDEILRLPLDTALVILRGQKVLKVEKYDYTLHPDAKKLVTKKASEHIPKWRENGQTEEYDYLPKPQAKSQKRRAYTTSKKTKEPVLPIQDPDYQEPDYDDLSEDLLKDDWKNSSEMVPLDKNSIMS